MAGITTTLETIDAQTTFDQDFLFLRAKILETAAVLDRVDRGEGDVAGDPRMAKVLEALEVLRRGAVRGEADRAEQVQLIFSRKYESDWRETFGV